MRDSRIALIYNLGIFLITLIIPKFIFASDFITYEKLTVTADNKIIDAVHVLLIDPRVSNFEFAFETDGNGSYRTRTIDGWQGHTGAPVIFNSCYYKIDGSPATVVIKNGEYVGAGKDEISKGALFVFGPKEKGLPAATVIEIDGTPVNPKKIKYKNCIQAMPLLIDKKGKIKAPRSSWRANRTVIGLAADGRIAVFVTEGTGEDKSFTLYEMAEWIKSLPFKVAPAVNLDGGYESELRIKYGDLDITSYGQWETNDSGDISVPGIKRALPFAIAVYKNK